MILQDWTIVRKRRMGLALVILAAVATLPPPGAVAKDARACTAGTTLRLSAPEASQGSLLLIELKSAKPLAEVQGEWNERIVPLWQEGTDQGQRRGLLGVDLEKAPGEYELKVTGQTAGGERISCNVMVAVQKGQFATEKLQVEKQFVEPSPEQVKRANEERQKLRDIFDRVTLERLWDGPFRIPLDGVTTGSNFGKRRILNGNPGSPHGGMDLPGTTGTPVHAAQRGRVALAEELFFSGKDRRKGRRLSGDRGGAGKSRGHGTRHGTASSLGTDRGTGSGEPASARETVGILLWTGGRQKAFHLEQSETIAPVGALRDRFERQSRARRVSDSTDVYDKARDRES